MRPPLQRRGKLTQVVIIGHWPTFMLAPVMLSLNASDEISGLRKVRVCVLSLVTVGQCN